MEKLGILKKKLEQSRTEWDNLSSNLNLINENFSDDKDFPEDFSYIYQAYAPISCRLVEKSLQPTSW